MCPIYLSSWANNESSIQWNIIYSLKNVVIKTTKPHKTIHCVTRREDAVKKLDDFCNFYHVKGIWLCHPKISHFGMKTVWGWKQLKQKTQKGLCLPAICLQAGQNCPLWRCSPSCLLDQENSLETESWHRDGSAQTNLPEITPMFP